MEKMSIGSLHFDAYHPVYRRSDETLWMKLNERFHAPAKAKDDYFICGGATAEFDPDEVVEVLHEAAEKKA